MMPTSTNDVACGYAAIPVRPNEPESPSPTPTRRVSSTAKYAVTIVATVALTLLAMLGLSSFTHGKLSLDLNRINPFRRHTPTHMIDSTMPVGVPVQGVMPAMGRSSGYEPPKTATDVVYGDLYQMEFTGISGAEGEHYDKKALCPKGRYVNKCLCNPIAMDNRDVCGMMWSARPFSDIHTRQDGCICSFMGVKACSDGSATMYLECTPW